MSRRLRITLLSLAAALLALTLGALLLAYVMLRPQRFTRMLRASAQNVGLELVLSAPAHPTLWPSPGVQLDGLQLFAKGQSYPILIADRGQLAVPWHALLGGPAAINKLELEAPRLSLDQLQHALSSQPATASHTNSLPNIDTGITIRNGALLHDDKVLLQGIGLQTGALAPGKAFSLHAQARDASGQPLQLDILFTPHQGTNGAVELTQMRIHADVGKAARAQLGGSMRWQGGTHLALALHGEVIMQNTSHYRLGIDLADTSKQPAQRLHMQIHGPSETADLHLSLPELIAWWRRVGGDHAPGPLPQLPLDGRIDADQLNIGNVQIHGLKLRAGDAVPASANSTQAPATEASTK